MKQNNNSLSRLFVGVAITAVIVGLLWYFRTVVIYILVSAILAIVGRPVVRFMSGVKFRHWSVPRWLASLLTLVLMWVVVIALCWLVIPLVGGRISSLSSLDLHSALSNIQQPIEHIQSVMSSLYLLPDEQVSLSEILINWLREVINLSTINAAFSSVIDISLSVVIVFFSISFITFFFMKEDNLFTSMVTSLFPESYTDNIIRALNKITVLLSRYFTGLLTESLILMVTISIILILFGMSTDDACIIGLIMGIMNVIPYAGPLMGGIASLFIGIVAPIDGCTIGHTLTLIVCVLLVVKGIDDFIIQPTLYSERVKAHPLEIFIVILMAASIAGIVGMLVAIPSYTVLRVFGKEFFSQYRLVKKLTENV
ncbi:MAG: AI-2E family transporter [Alistipes sp.]|nr:AI-2E family transporter [Alistipes sp.]